MVCVTTTLGSLIFILNVMFASILRDRVTFNCYLPKERRSSRYIGRAHILVSKWCRCNDSCRHPDSLPPPSSSDVRFVCVVA